MLDEGRRRLARGTDVVVGLVETHGRDAHRGDGRGARGAAPRPARAPRRGARGDGPRRACWPGGRPSRSSTSSRTPTCPGSRHEKRWQDVDELLDAGIDVISTVNIQHLESLNDVVESITGVRQRETVPDEVVRRADQIELVDMSPEALRRRMAHGNIYKAGAGRRRAGELLPGRQPLGAARAGAAVAGRPGRRGAGALPRRPRHRLVVADPRAGRRRAHGRPGGRDPAAPRRPHRLARRRRRAARGARRPGRRAERRRRCPASRRCAGSPTSSAGRGHAVTGADLAEAILDVARGRQRHAGRHRAAPAASAGAPWSCRAPPTRSSPTRVTSTCTW